jgi:transposase-like protein
MPFPRPRTRRPFTDADLARLRALYEDRAIPLQKIADEFAVPVSTLLRWVAEMDWPRRRAGGALPAPTLLPTAPAPPGERRRKPVPGLRATLESVSALARRELADLAANPPRTMEERERVARLVASLTRSLDRVGAALRDEKGREYDRAFGRRLRALRQAQEASG